MENVCKQCATVLTGRRDAQYCSDACRKAHKRSMAVSEPDLTLVSSSTLQQQYNELEAKYKLKVYTNGIFVEALNDFMNDNPQLRSTIQETYVRQVLLRRDRQGEADQLKKHFDIFCKDGEVYTNVANLKADK